MKKRLSYTLFLLITVPLLLEALLWLAGFRPYTITDFSISSKPDNCLIAHNELGIALNPGNYEVTMNEALTYKVTHADGSVRSHSLHAYDSSRKDMAIFGCSYTYGIGENDDEVVGALLSNMLAQYNVTSWAVPSYGNVQGYLQLKELVESDRKPDVAIFNFADFHVDRNVLSPQYRLHLGIAYERALGDQKTNMNNSRFPYVQWSHDSLIFRTADWSELYSGFPGRNWSALINAVQSAKESWQTRSLKPSESTIALFELIDEFCTQHEIKLIVTGITEKEETAQLLSQLQLIGISTLYIGLPTQNKEYNHLPHDTHPNAKAHRFYAQGIYSYLQNNQIAWK